MAEKRASQILHLLQSGNGALFPDKHTSTRKQTMSVQMPLNPGDKPSPLPHTCSPTPLPNLSIRPSPRPMSTPHIQRFPPPNQLIAPVKLHLHRTPYFQGAYSRPNTPLAAQDPVLQAFLRGVFEQFDQVAWCQFGYKRQACAGDGFVY